MIRLAVVGGHSNIKSYSALAPRLLSAEIAIVVSEEVGTQQRLSGIAGVVESDVGSLLSTHSDCFDAVVFDGLCIDFPNFAIALASAGKQILVSDESFRSIADVEYLAEAFTKSEARLMVGHELRHRSDVKPVQEALTSGRIGKPGLLRIHHWKRSLPDGSMCLVDRMLDKQLDLACWLFGHPPEIAFCRRQGRAIDRRGADRFDFVQIHLGFPDQGMALIDVSHSEDIGANYSTLSLIGSTGAAYADDHHNTQLLIQADGCRGQTTEETHVPLQSQLQDFVDAIVENREPRIDVDALRTMFHVDSMITKSVATGEAVHWEDVP